MEVEIFWSFMVIDVRQWAREGDYAQPQFQACQPGGGRYGEGTSRHWIINYLSWKIPMNDSGPCSHIRSNMASATTPRERVNMTLCVPSAPLSRYHGTSLTTPASNSIRKYLRRSRLCANPLQFLRHLSGTSDVNLVIVVDYWPLVISLQKALSIICIIIRIVPFDSIYYMKHTWVWPLQSLCKSLNNKEVMYCRLLSTIQYRLVHYMKLPDKWRRNCIWPLCFVWSHGYRHRGRLFWRRAMPRLRRSEPSKGTWI